MVTSAGWQSHKKSLQPVDSFGVEPLPSPALPMRSVGVKTYNRFNDCTYRMRSRRRKLACKNRRSNDVEAQSAVAGNQVHLP